MPESDRSRKKPRTAAKPKREAPKTPAAAEEGGNAILFQDEKPAASGGSLRVERVPKTERTTGGKSTAAAGEDARARQIPDIVRERFIQIGNNYFFPDGAEAFTDHGNRVTTRSENAIVIQSMVAIAQARSPGKVTVTGTDFFKKEAWFAARLAGLEVAGYTPSALEQERLVRAMARRRTAESGEETPRQGATAERPNSDVRRVAAKSAEQGELIVGRLVDHGPAPYQHKPAQPMSYYVRIETESGDREIWGVDLERAVRQSLSTPGIGDEVGLRTVGRDPVTVSAPRLDRLGRELGRDELGVHRNKWILETKEFLDRRFTMADTFRNASISAAEAVEQYPELQGSYLQLQMARAGVEQRIMGVEAREQFVEHLRAHLAKTIEYGQPLEPVHLRARTATVLEKAQEPGQTPER